MSDTSQGPGWWLASDGRWYPPHLYSSPAENPPAPRSHPAPDDRWSAPERPAADQTVEILATKARLSWLKFFFIESSESARGTVPEARGDDGTSAATASKWPSVVVVNRVGQTKRIIGKLHSDEEAMAQADRVRTELDTLGMTQWCEKYKIPLKWAQRGLP
jgi:hypothetical protein